MEDAIEQIKLIRKLIKAKVKTVSVRNETGTAWGWIAINGSADYGNFTDKEEKALRENFGLITGKSNCYLINPEDRIYYIKKWTGQLTQADKDQQARNMYSRSYD